MKRKVKYVYEYRLTHKVDEDGLNYLQASKVPVACVVRNEWGDIGITVCKKGDRMSRKFAREVAEIRSYKNDVEASLSKIPAKRTIVDRFMYTVSLKDQVTTIVRMMQEYAEPELT
jgi:hypothetical protein